MKIALNKEEMPLEVLVTMIDNGLIEEEIPFDLITNEYPELLEKWYPGFPGIPRLMNEDDPFCVDGIKDGEFVIIQGVPGIDRIHVPGLVESEFEMGKCKVWLRKEADEWIIILQKESNGRKK
jgi:hypothetical protein